VVESRPGCHDYHSVSLVSEAITGASVVVKLPVYERAWSVSDVITCVSMVTLELLRSTSGGSRQRDRINAEDTKVTLVGYEETPKKAACSVFRVCQQRIYDNVKKGFAVYSFIRGFLTEIRLNQRKRSGAQFPELQVTVAIYITAATMNSGS